MSKQEVGRMLLDNITLIEYESSHEENGYFVQCGVAGFYATASELKNLYGLLNYYYNIDAVENTVISVKSFYEEQ